MAPLSHVVPIPKRELPPWEISINVTTSLGPGAHQFCPVSRLRVDGTPGESGTSTILVDIGTEVDGLPRPL